MVATLILAIILLLVFSITQQTSEAWKSSAARIESFQGARAAFDSMTRRICQATLNTYYDYFDRNGKARTVNLHNFVPSTYGRYSDLHFVSGKQLLDGAGGLPRQAGHSLFFQAGGGYTGDSAVEGMEDLLNGYGYFVEYSEDISRPPFLSDLRPAPVSRFRYRLMQFIQRTEILTIYSDPPSDPFRWFKTPLALTPAERPVHQLSENIVALIVLPKRSEKDEEKAASLGRAPLSPEFEYDSKRPIAPMVPQPPQENQLPPLIEIVMVAVDEASFSRLGNLEAPPAAISGAHDDLFKSSEDLEHDLRMFEAILLAKPGNLTGNTIKLKYQIFRTEVPIRTAKWSE